MTDEELLANYAKEVDIFKWSVGSLIESHRNLRELNKKTSNERHAEWLAARERGYKFGLEQATEEAIINKIKSMSVMDLVSLLAFSDEE